MSNRQFLGLCLVLVGCYVSFLSVARADLGGLWSLGGGALIAAGCAMILWPRKDSDQDN